MICDGNSEQIKNCHAYNNHECMNAVTCGSLNKDIDKKCETCGGSGVYGYNTCMGRIETDEHCLDCNGTGTTERDEPIIQLDKIPFDYSLVKKGKVSELENHLVERNNQIAKLQEQIEEMKNTIGKMYSCRYEPDKIDIYWHKHIKETR